MGNLLERFSKRQPNSIDYPQLMEHIARTQKALRQGTVQMDLGILRTDYYLNSRITTVARDYGQNNLHQHKGVYWQDTTLQDAGYTYDYFSPMLLQDSDITCENGLIQADGVGYQALMIYRKNCLMKVPKSCITGQNQAYLLLLWKALLKNKSEIPW